MNSDGDNNRNDTDNNSFECITMTPMERRARNKKLWTIGLVLGGMTLTIVILMTAIIAYSIGVSTCKADNSTATANTASDSANTSNDNLSDNAAQYKSPDVVGDNQIPDHYQGNENADNTVLVYTDHTCSYCIQLSQSVDDLHSEYGENVRFIYRNYSLGHTYSDITAKIAEAGYIVGGNDGYWKISKEIFSDEIWSNGDYLETDQINQKIRDYASSAGLDEQRLIDAYNDSANNGIDSKLERDRELAKEGDIAGTPTVYINGVESSPSASSIANKLDEILNK